MDGGEKRHKKLAVVMSYQGRGEEIYWDLNDGRKWVVGSQSRVDIATVSSLSDSEC